MLVLWLAVSNMRPQQKLLFLFYVKKYFRIKKWRRQKLMRMLLNQVLFSLEIRKYASFAEMNIMLLKKQSYCRLIVEICIAYLWNFVTLIYWKFFLLLKHFSSLSTDFVCHVFFSFFEFLMTIITETTHNSCSFQLKCSINILAMILT